MNKLIARDLDLDIAVATEILGWTLRLQTFEGSKSKVKHWHLYDRAGMPIGWDYGSVRRTARRFPTERDAWENAVPSFSINMHDCWKVVEQMTEIPTYSKQAAECVWNTRFVHWFERTAIGLACNDEAGAAREICDAALKIVRYSLPF